MQTRELAESIHAKMWPLFVYVHDQKQYNIPDHWTSHAAAVNGNVPFEDDCDGYACTAAELLAQAGIPKELILLVYCQTETGEAHLVCGVSDLDDTYIIDNRYSYIYSWTSKPSYKWIVFNQLSEPQIWKKIT